MAHIRTNPDKRTLMVDISAPKEILEHVRSYVEENDFAMKPEFHMTLIGFKLGSEIMRFPKETYDQVVALAESFVWELEYTDKFYRVKKTYTFTGKSPETREALLVVVLPQDLEIFWTKFCDIVGKQFPLPFPHISLAARSTNPTNMTMGIGIQSFEEFDQIEHEKILI